MGRFLAWLGRMETDRYRDTVRSYWKGDEGKLADFAARMSGCLADLFNRRGRKAVGQRKFYHRARWFTLNDLVSYENKHNEANGEDNRDGHSDNRSCNYGAEGTTDDPRNHRDARAPKSEICSARYFSLKAPR